MLLQGKYDEALKVYQDYTNNTSQYDDQTNVEVLLQDFKDLKNARITHKDIEKVKKALQKKE